MPSKQLMGIWVFLDVCLLAAGAFMIAFSFVFRTPDLLRDLVISGADLKAGLILGIAFIFSWMFSIGAIIQKNHITIGLSIFKWILFLDGVGVLSVGTFIWFYTLTERNDFHQVLSTVSPETIIQVQDALQCCGYFNSSDLIQIGGSFCANATFVDVTNNATGNFCVGPFTDYADFTLNNIFSTIYGFMAVVIGLGLATMCLINKRQEKERFKRIDAKRGGRGFA